MKDKIAGIRFIVLLSAVTGYWPVAVLSGLGAALMWLIDLFSLSRQTDIANEYIEAEIINEIAAAVEKSPSDSSRNSV